MAAASRPILLIEDDVTTRDAVQELLEMEGYAVVAAGDGDEALRDLRGGLRPCFILLDLDMPEKDGFEFRDEQLQDAALAGIPTVAYSAVYDPQSYGAALHGAALLSKPIEFEMLLDCIQSRCLKD